MRVPKKRRKGVGGTKRKSGRQEQATSNFAQRQKQREDDRSPAQGRMRKKGGGGLRGREDPSLERLPKVKKIRGWKKRIDTSRRRSQLSGDSRDSMKGGRGRAVGTETKKKKNHSQKTAERTTVQNRDRRTKKERAWGGTAAFVWG